MFINLYIYLFICLPKYLCYSLICLLPRCKFLMQSCFLTICKAQKLKFSIKDFFSKCDQIRSFLRFGHIYLRNPWWKTSFFVQCWYCILVSIDAENLLVIISVYYLFTMTLGKSILILLFIIQRIFCLTKSSEENMTHWVIRMFMCFYAGGIFQSWFKSRLFGLHAFFAFFRK